MILQWFWQENSP